MQKIRDSKVFRHIGTTLLYIFCVVTMVLSVPSVRDTFLPSFEDFLAKKYGLWIFAGCLTLGACILVFHFLQSIRISHRENILVARMRAHSVRIAANPDSLAILEAVKNIDLSGNVEDIQATIDRANQEIQTATDEIAAIKNNGDRSISDVVGESALHDSQSIRTPLFATVVRGIVTSRLSIACLALLVCLVAEGSAYSFELVDLTNGTRYWFYGIAGIAVFDCLLAKMRQYTGAYGNRTIELLEVAAEVSKHIDNGSGPGSGKHFYIDEPRSRGTSLETAPRVQRGVVS